ncbi:MAG: twin-arginine translocation signal domain-containing protein, partial [Candidatus Dormibacteraeota bacterium]|nr:twin-arginine translocation signal domain-containing protein [Candidatus Dormibacteraeota bacterium]
MKPQGQSSTVTSEMDSRAVGAEVTTRRRRLVGRRWFLKGVGAVGATLPAGALLATQAQAAN